MSNSQKLLLFSPMPPSKSGIADYSFELARKFDALYDLVIVIDDDAPEPTWSPERGRIVRLADLDDSLKGEDVPRVYHMGNNHLYHEYIYREMQSHPGITVMHDFSMHHFLVELTLARDDYDSYAELLKLQYGDVGERIAANRRDGLFNHLLEFTMPLNQTVIESSRGILVHSNQSYYSIKLNYPDVPVVKIPFPHSDDLDGCVLGGKAKARQHLGIPEKELVLSTFGFVTPTKQVDLILNAISEIKQGLPDFKIYLVGEVSPAVPIDDLLKQYDLVGHVEVLGYVEFEAFHHYIEASDIIFCLRYPSAGETSAALLRAMGMGRCCVAFDYASYADFPDECLVKIPLNTYDEEPLKDKVLYLAQNGEMLEKIEKNSEQYIREHHDISLTIDSYIEFINSIYFQ